MISSKKQVTILLIVLLGIFVILYLVLNNPTSKDTESFYPLDIEYEFSIDKGDSTVIDSGTGEGKLIASFDFSALDTEKTYVYESNVNMKQEVTNGGNSIVIEQDLLGTYEIVYYHTGDSHNIIIGNMHYVDMEITSKSGNPHVNRQLSTTMGALKKAYENITFTFTVDNRGNIIDINTSEKKNEINLTGSDFVKQFTDALKSMFIILPNDTVGVGGSWTSSLKAYSDVGATEISTENIYTYSSLDDAGNVVLQVNTTQTDSGIAISQGSGKIILSPYNPHPNYNEQSLEIAFQVPLGNGEEMTMKQTIYSITNLVE